MKTVTTRSRRAQSLTHAAALCLLALAAVALRAEEARAQWTTSGTNTTTTSSVGVGTTDPSQGNAVGSRFTVATTDDAATAIATSNGTTPRFALNNHADGSWTMHDYFGNAWHEGITQQSGFVGIGLRSPQYQLDLLSPTDKPFRVRDTSGREYIATSSRTGPVATWTTPVVSLSGGRLIVENNGPEGDNHTVIRRVVNNIIFNPSDHPDLPGSIVVMQKGGNPAMVINQNTNGNVGIGTWSPSTAKLVISGTAGLTGLDLSSTDQYAEMRVIRNSLNPGDKDLYLQWQAGAGSKTHFYSDNAETMTIKAGNVGIGTASPASKLHVAGNVTIDGNINAKWQDVAEWVPSLQKLSPGTVVTLDTARDNHVVASTTSYDTRVAGVVSAQPGLTLGEAGEGKALVATTGRVRVKVDATRGAIHVGDLLVTSDVPGVAMLSQPLDLGGVPIHRPGTLIGKALESLEKGTGEILVLLSLQ
jgi:hypothetical protein